MNNFEHLHQEEDENDYDREPPLDSVTTSINRSRSKYVFTTLCFLLALVLLYTYLNGTVFADITSSWFPLIGALVLAVLGMIFLKSPDDPTERTSTPPSPLPSNDIETAEQKSEPLSDFEALVQEALASIPDQFQQKMDNVAVHVVYEPDPAILQRLEVPEGRILLGLYEGVPLTAYGQSNSAYPEVITIYQHSIEQYCHSDPERIREQVRATVLHEVAHHFGMGHEAMPIWVGGS